MFRQKTSSYQQSMIEPGAINQSHLCDAVNISYTDRHHYRGSLLRCPPDALDVCGSHDFALEPHHAAIWVEHAERHPLVAGARKPSYIARIQ